MEDILELDCWLMSVSMDSLEVMVEFVTTTLAVTVAPTHHTQETSVGAYTNQ